MQRLGRRPHPRMTGHEHADRLRGAGHGIFAGRCRRANLRVVNLAAEFGRARHQAERHDRRQQHDRQLPAIEPWHATPLPERQPGQKAGDLHDRERQKRGVLVRAHGARRDVRPILHDRLGGVPRQVGRDGDDGDDEEHHEAGARQVVVPFQPGDDEERERDAEPHRGHVIEPHVHVRRVRQHLEHFIHEVVQALSGPLFSWQG